MSGTSEGHKKAGAISASKIRAILESAHGIRPDDKSESAVKARSISSYADLCDLRFMGKVGVTKAQNGYEPKNTLAEIITPDRVQWAPITQVAKAEAVTPAQNSAPGIVPAEPAWA